MQPLRKQQPKPDTPWSSRNISKAVQDLYEVTATDLRVVFPYFDNDGMRIAAKIRLQGKEFKTEGDFKNSVLFGSQTLGKDVGVSSDTLIVTEGEADALAAFQMVNGVSRCPDLQQGQTFVQDCPCNVHTIRTSQCRA